MKGNTMTNLVKPGKTVLDAREANMLVAGLEALARENQRMSADAAREGYHPQAREFADRAREAGSMASLARSAGITKITVRHA